MRALCLYICLAISLSGASLAFAFSPLTKTPSQPYELVSLTAPAASGEYVLGILAGYPVMYELTSAKPFSLSFKIAQAVPGGDAPPLAFSVLAVASEARGGVREVARLTGDDLRWQREFSGTLGVPLLESQTVSREVAAGTYRIEVSTPENRGAYLLTIGEAPLGANYFSSLANIRQAQAELGYGWWWMLRSNYLFYPLATLFLVVTGWYVYREQRRNSAAHG